MSAGGALSNWWVHAHMQTAVRPTCRSLCCCWRVTFTRFLFAVSTSASAAHCLVWSRGPEAPFMHPLVWVQPGNVMSLLAILLLLLLLLLSKSHLRLCGRCHMCTWCIVPGMCSVRLAWSRCFSSLLAYPAWQAAASTMAVSWCGLSRGVFATPRTLPWHIAAAAHGKTTHMF
jgi:hypothetical protein